MERLTLDEAVKYIKEVVQKNRKNKEKHTIIIPNSFISSNDCAEKYEQVANWLEQLKSYKDIGNPKELKELKENGAFTGLELVKLSIMQKELKEYKDLEKQGLLVRLPCKVGDILFRINKGARNPIIKMKVFRITIISKSYNIKAIEEDCGEVLFSNDVIGIKVFLTREEAEKKLEEMKKNGE